MSICDQELSSGRHRARASVTEIQAQPGHDGGRGRLRGAGMNDKLQIWLQENVIAQGEPVSQLHHFLDSAARYQCVTQLRMTETEAERVVGATGQNALEVETRSK